MTKEELFTIVKRMPIRSEEVRGNIYLLENDSDSMAFNLIRIFNYGYMMGKRDERAKKKKAIS